MTSTISVMSPCLHVSINDNKKNMEAVCQQQMVVALISLRQLKKLKETKVNGQLTSYEKYTFLVQTS